MHTHRLSTHRALPSRGGGMRQHTRQPRRGPDHFSRYAEPSGRKSTFILFPHRMSVPLQRRSNLNELCGLGAEPSGGLALHEHHLRGGTSGRDHGSPFSYVRSRHSHMTSICRTGAWSSGDRASPPILDILYKKQLIWLLFAWSTQSWKQVPKQVHLT